MTGKVKTLYYAVSRRGQGVLYTGKPERVERLGLWAGTIEGCYCSVVADMEASGLIRLPQLTYDDDPVELKLHLSYG